jgi:tetratricopeptide (TPR) repeat protein
VASDPLLFADAVAVIVDYSLAKRIPAGLQLHRLIQAALRLRHTSVGEGLIVTATVDGVAIALRLLVADAPREIMGVPGSWPRWAVLLPHVLTATGHFDDAHAGGGEAADCSLLLDRAATFLKVRGQFADARPLAERALAIGEAALGPDHPDVGTLLSNLALILRNLGQPEQARPLAERALAIGEAALGPDHPDIGTRLNNLAAILRDLGQPEQARPLAERALTITEAALGPHHPTVGTLLNNLAAILRDLGQPEQARPLAERARAISDKAPARVGL